MPPREAKTVALNQKSIRNARNLLFMLGIPAGPSSVLTFIRTRNRTTLIVDHTRNAGWEPALICDSPSFQRAE
jgi:hypothetical protein